VWVISLLIGALVFYGPVASIAIRGLYDEIEIAIEQARVERIVNDRQSDAGEFGSGRRLLPEQVARLAEQLGLGQEMLGRRLDERKVLNRKAQSGHLSEGRYSSVRSGVEGPVTDYEYHVVGRQVEAGKESVGLKGEELTYRKAQTTLIERQHRGVLENLRRAFARAYTQLPIFRFFGEAKFADAYLENRIWRPHLPSEVVKGSELSETHKALKAVSEYEVPKKKAEEAALKGEYEALKEQARESEFRLEQLPKHHETFRGQPRHMEPIKALGFFPVVGLMTAVFGLFGVVGLGSQVDPKTLWLAASAAR
jgi:hypothetical protein